MRRSALTLAAALLSALPAPAVWAGDLTVTVVGVRSDKGKFSLGLYGEKDDWPDGKTFQQVDIPPRPGDITYVFKDLPPGRYAISGFHDENHNGLFDTNFIGMPKEGFVFSNDAKPGIAPPSFQAAAFEVGNGPATASMHVEYWASTR